MINKKFSKCSICGKEEKYIRWVKKGNETKMIKYCKDKCKFDNKDNR